MHIQYPTRSAKWGLKTLKSVQNEVPRGTWSHQNNENVEKVKSNENTGIYNTFERLGHENSRDFLVKNHQKAWLQSKCDFELLKSEKIWKSDAEGSPMGDPKSIKNHWKSILVPSEWTLAPTDPQNNEKVVSRDPECLRNGLPRPRKINKSERKPTGPNWQLLKQNDSNLLGKMFLITQFSNASNPANLWNPAAPSDLQISSQLVARGAGGRGGAFRNPPRWCKAPATRRVEARAVKPEPCTHSCTMYILCVKTQELTLVSSF